MEFDWVMACGLRWFVGPKFVRCDGWNGLGWVEEIVPTDNSVIYENTSIHWRYELLLLKASFSSLQSH